MSMNCSRYVKISMLVTALIACPAFAQDDPPGNYRLEIGDRPAAPYPALPNYNARLDRSGAGTEYTVPVARHHIIPFNVLRAFYNNVVDNGDILLARTFFNQFGNMIPRYFGANANGCAANAVDLQAVANMLVNMGFGLIRDGGDNYPQAWDNFESFYAWMPWNLFIGPEGGRRTDDPGEGFEENAQYIINDNERFQRLRQTYDDMLAYNANRDTPTLRRILENLSRLSRRQRVYQLNANHWESVGNNYRIRQGGHHELRKREINEDYHYRDKRVLEEDDSCGDIKPDYGVISVII